MYLFLISLLLIILPVFQQAGSTSAQAEQKPDGLYYLVLSGDANLINRACSYGDCGRGFATRIDALNYWTGSLFGPSMGISIAPIPQQIAQAEPPIVLKCIGDPVCMSSVLHRSQPHISIMNGLMLREPPVICFKAPCDEKPPRQKPPVKPPVICIKAPCP